MTREQLLKLVKEAAENAVRYQSNTPGEGDLEWSTIVSVGEHSFMIRGLETEMESEVQFTEVNVFTDKFIVEVVYDLFSGQSGTGGIVDTDA